MLKKSYFHQPGNVAYSYETIPERIQKLAEEKPDKIAMVMYLSKDERYEITRKELYDRSVKFARCLLKLGIKKGDRVAYCVSNCINWMAYDVGILMAGGISVHLLLGAADISKALDSCTFIILDAKDHWDDLLSVAEIHPGGRITSDTCPSLKFGIAVSSDSGPVNVLQASELIAEIDAKDDGGFLEFPVLDPDDTAFICLTSGTTGTPKKIHHSHFNILNCTAAHNEDVNITWDNVTYSCRPMAYIGGYPIGYLNTGSRLVSGDTIFLSDPQNFETVVDIWRKEGCTVVGLAPHNLKYLRDFGFRIRCIVSGGDLLTKEMINHSFTFADAMLLVYGSTEAILISQRIFTKSNIKDHLQGMLGRPSQGVEVKIVNERNETVKLGETGIVSVRCAWIAKNYDDGSLNSPLKDGWLQTTDVAMMLPGGDLIMKGRTSDFIIKGTVNLPIQLIESYVDNHPDVQSVVVVGVPDVNCGEDVCACVQLFPGRKFDSGSLREFCENNMQYKSSFDWVTMVPNYFLRFDEFPTLENGKLNKKKIKELAIERIKSDQYK